MFIIGRTAARTAFDAANCPANGGSPNNPAAACIAAQQSLMMNARCSNVTQQATSAISSDDCTACRGVVEALVAACGDLVSE